MSREVSDDWEPGRSDPCPPKCPCLCHRLDVEDPGPRHHVLCAYADPDYDDDPFGLGT